MTSVIGQAVRRNRESLGLSAATLAHHAAITEVELRDFEQGAIDLDATLLSRIARVMGLPPVAFLADHEAQAAMSPVASARFFHSDNAPILSDADVLAIARDVRRAEVFAELAKPPVDLSTFTPREPGPLPWRNGYDLASTLRTRLGLGAAGIPSMQLLLEDRLGILVSRQAFSDARLRAVAVRGTRGRLVVVSKRLSIPLARISLAHELCHQLCDLPLNASRSDEELGTRERIAANAHESADEQRAKAFAVMFLAPKALVRDLFGEPAHQFQHPDRALECAAELAATCGMSQIAALWHLFHLQYLATKDEEVASIAPRVGADGVAGDFERTLGGVDGFARAIDAALAADEIDEDQAERLREL